MDFNDNQENRKLIKIITALDFHNQEHKRHLRELILNKFKDEKNAVCLTDDDLEMVAGGLKRAEDKNE